MITNVADLLFHDKEVIDQPFGGGRQGFFLAQGQGDRAVAGGVESVQHALGHRRDADRRDGGAEAERCVVLQRRGQVTDAEDRAEAAELADALDGCSTSLAIGAAHSAQNLAPGGFSKPHRSHRRLNGDAHWMQNFAPSGFSAEQFRQRIDFPTN